ncbi:Flavodoxin-like domain-containing protein [Aphelenchoides fujianensis]|nr:Flavodoxin-like domain-containing protein [Aphelenchoides fujianensis]
MKAVVVVLLLLFHSLPSVHSFVDPKQWPPERGFPREPKAQQVQMSTFEKIVRYAEKDDLLLYATALFGILMPAVMYFVYKAAHTKYLAYSKRKREERRRERAKQRAVTLFYMSADTALKRFTYALAENLTGVDPAVVALVPENLNMFYNYKGTAVFVVPDVDTDQLTDADNWFFDWLQEMRFEMRERSLLAHVGFAIYTVVRPDQEEAIGKMSALLSKRLIGLEAKEVQPPVLIWNNKDTDMELQLEQQAELLQASMRETRDGYNSDDTDLLSSEGGRIAERILR